MNYLDRFKVVPGAKVKLQDIDPNFKDRHSSREAAAPEIQHYQQRLRELQELLYAEHKRSMLICLQAMDTGGKDGTINHVLGAMNPLGCRVVSFKQPTREEAAHDFLWRIHGGPPEKGEVVIFNRSQYEDVLVVRVHHLVAKGEWSLRYDRINDFEKELTDSGTHILKFYLHISKDEQLARFKARLDDPTKQWKISEADYAERKFWDAYQEAFEDALAKCSTDCAPWFAIPANHKWFRNLAVARIVVEYMEGLDMKYPPPTVDLDLIRKDYHQAKDSV